MARYSLVTFVFGALLFVIGLSFIFYDSSKQCAKEERAKYRRYAGDGIIVSALGVMTIAAGIRFGEDISRYSK